MHQTYHNPSHVKARLTSLSVKEVIRKWQYFIQKWCAEIWHGAQVIIMFASPLRALQRTLAFSHHLPPALNFTQFYSPELLALGRSRRELQSPIPLRQWDQVLAAAEVRLKCFVTWICQQRKSREKSPLPFLSFCQCPHD